MSASFIDILIFAVLAVFLIFRLRSVLGRRDGFEQKPSRQNRSVSEVDDSPASKLIAETPTSGEGLEAIIATDPHFSKQAFLDGAKQAYAVILKYFAEGDTESLKPLLGYEMNASFVDAIHERNIAGEDLSITLVKINTVEIITATISDGMASIVVEFNSLQKRCLKAEDGTLIDNDLDSEETFVDQWTFERDVTASNPNWLLVETEVVTE